MALLLIVRLLRLQHWSFHPGGRHSKESVIMIEELASSTHSLNLRPYQCGCQKSIAATQIAPNVITSQNQFLSSHDPEPPDPLIAILLKEISPPS